MTDKVIENNRVTIVGEVVSEFEFSHEVYGEGFYTLNISVNRLSDSVDIIPLMISERLVDVTEDLRGVIIEASGQFRSYNRHEEQKNRLVLSVFVRELEFIDEELDGAKTNHILLEGYICKKPIYRQTPFGREIADLLLAVNRAYNKSDYIPTIAWGRNARFCQNLEVGAQVKIIGRVQSRQYEKKYEDGTSEMKVAYEVSICSLELINEEGTEKKEETDSQEAV